MNSLSRWRAVMKAFYHRLGFRFAGPTVSYQLGSNEVVFHADSFQEYRRFQSLMGEEDVLEELLRNLQTEDVFFDIGANVGAYSAAAAEAIPNGRIVAFEPEPQNANRLRLNADINDQVIEIHQLALSDTTGATYLKRTGGVGAGEHTLAESPTDDTIEVEQAVGDELIDSGQVPVPNVIKIDVEGAEGKVLDGLELTLTLDACRLVFCEVHPDRLRSFGYHPDQLMARLTESGFAVGILKEMGDKFFLKAEKPDVE